MSSENSDFCPGEILYASSYGGMEDYTFVNSITATAAWLEAVKEIKAVVCETNRTFWMDFDLNSATVLADDEETAEVDPYLLFARRYCYRKFCETYCGYFGLTEIFGYLYRVFSNRHKDPPDEYDFAYADFVDSLLEDVRFIVCVRKRRAPPEMGGGGLETRQENCGNSITAVAEERVLRQGKTTSTTTPSLFSIVDDYIEDDLLDMDLDDVRPASPFDPAMTSTPMKRAAVVVDDARAQADDHTTLPPPPPPQKKKWARKTQPLFADYFVDSPMAAEMAPDSSLQDEAADASVADVASMGFDSTAETSGFAHLESSFTGENENDTSDFTRMPLTILYDPVTGGERILGYEPETAKQQYSSMRRLREEDEDGVYVLDGLYDEPARRGEENIIEITYAVGPLGKVLSFNAIGVFNGAFEKTGRRGSVKLELNEFIRALRSLDSGARLLNATQLDLYSFEVDLSGLHPASFLKRRRKLFLRFVKR